jgi:hypothetical protein
MSGSSALSGFWTLPRHRSVPEARRNAVFPSKTGLGRESRRLVTDVAVMGWPLSRPELFTVRRRDRGVPESVGAGGLFATLTGAQAPEARKRPCVWDL